MKNNIELKLTKKEIELLQLVLTQYIVDNKNKKEIKQHIEDAEILLSNINFYKRQTND